METSREKARGGKLAIYSAKTSLQYRKSLMLILKFMRKSLKLFERALGLKLKREDLVNSALSVHLILDFVEEKYLYISFGLLALLLCPIHARDDAHTLGAAGSLREVVVEDVSKARPRFSH